MRLIAQTFLLCSALLAATAAAATPMTLEDITRLRSVSEAAVSPSGRHVAYVQRVPRRPLVDEDGPAWAELHVLTEGRRTRRFIRGEVNVSNLAWAPDGAEILFLAEHGEGKDAVTALKAIPVDGGEAYVRCTLDTDIAGYELSPDGSQVALLATPAEDEQRRKLEGQGMKARVVEEDVRDQQVRIASLGPDGSCEAETLDVEGHVAAAHWSPDGRRLLLAVAPSSLIDARYMETRLRITDLDGDTRTEINNLGKLGDASWSPDGGSVAFLGVDDINDPREGRLKLADARTGALRDALPELAGHVLGFTWDGPGRVLALVHRGVDSELWAVDLASGSHQVRVPAGGPILRSVVRASDADRVVAVADAPEHPPELYDLGGDPGQAPRRLTDSNPWLAERELGRQTVVEYQARDGLALQGLLIWPTNYRRGREYPLVIFVHGGPEAHRSDGWLTSYSQPTQVLAGEGYFSFVPNYRGSTGRGVAFSKLGQHAYATPEFDDIVDGKDHLVEQGLVDPEKVGITGGSYGGFATAWSATALTEHYAAGVMFVGVSNQLSKFGTTDIPNEMFLVHARAWPWDDWQFYLERSPVYHAQKSKTPLLIMHGDSDPRVHPAQSLEMYRYLKTAGQAPVRLVLYPGEQHGNRKAAARYDYSLRLVRWMDHYLKGPGGEPPPHELGYSELLGD